ncbi:MAG: hypothetical protein CME71_06540 [Halobacteriovorax sp.]|nr:hypothetical protein [Halobacteriovorax sp.]
MSTFSVGCIVISGLALWGLWIGAKALGRYWSYRSSRNAAPRFDMRDSGMRIRLDKCPGEYCVLDMSQSGMAIFIDHFVDGFSLAKRTKFVLRNSHGDVAAKLVTGKVIYLKQLSHGYRLGVQFDFPMEAEIVEAFRSQVEHAEDHIEEYTIAA